MTNLRAGLIALGCGLLGTPAVAEAGTSIGTHGGFEVGGELFDYSYRERDGGATIVRDDGTFGGITGTYVETIGSGWFLKARLTLGWGSVDYSSDDGSRLDGVPQDFGQLELLAGRDFAVGAVTLTPYAGVGARVLNDNSGGRMTSDGLAGYDREVSYGYWPVGVTARLPLGKRATLTLSGQANFVTNGEAVSRFSELDPDVPDVKLDLPSGTGWELTAAVSLPVGSSRISVGPFARGWQIDRSRSAILADAEGAIELFEPKTRTVAVGLRAAFAF